MPQLINDAAAEMGPPWRRIRDGHSAAKDDDIDNNDDDIIARLLDYRIMARIHLILLPFFPGRNIYLSVCLCLHDYHKSLVVSPVGLESHVKR